MKLLSCQVCLIILIKVSSRVWFDKNEKTNKVCGWVSQIYYPFAQQPLKGVKFHSFRPTMSPWRKLKTYNILAQTGDANRRTRRYLKVLISEARLPWATATRTAISAGQNYICTYTYYVHDTVFNPLYICVTTIDICYVFMYSTAQLRELKSLSEVCILITQQTFHVHIPSIICKHCRCLCASFYLLKENYFSSGLTNWGQETQPPTTALECTRN